MVLAYFFGDENGYVLAISPTGEKLTPLFADESAAESLGIEAGPLTAALLKRADWPVREGCHRHAGRATTR